MPGSFSECPNTMPQSQVKKAQHKDWLRMNTKLGQLLPEGKNASVPPRRVFEHPNARIASRVNRMRTQRTMFQKRKLKKTFCNFCHKPSRRQCAQCHEKEASRVTYAWNKCACGQMNSLEHMIGECEFERGMVTSRNVLLNFHSVTRSHGEAAALGVNEATDGGRPPRDAWKLDWKGVLVPTGGSQRWNHRNNELIYALRKRFVALSKWWPPPLPEPPPIDPSLPDLRQLPPPSPPPLPRQALPPPPPIRPRRPNVPSVLDSS